jgi:hypothetical protein
MLREKEADADRGRELVPMKEIGAWTSSINLSTMNSVFYCHLSSSKSGSRFLNEPNNKNYVVCSVARVAC